MSAELGSPPGQDFYTKPYLISIIVGALDVHADYFHDERTADAKTEAVQKIVNLSALDKDFIKSIITKMKTDRDKGDIESIKIMANEIKTIMDNAPEGIKAALNKFNSMKGGARAMRKYRSTRSKKLRCRSRSRKNR